MIYNQLWYSLRQDRKVHNSLLKQFLEFDQILEEQKEIWDMCTSGSHSLIGEESGGVAHLSFALRALQLLAERVHDGEGGVNTTVPAERLRRAKLARQTLAAISECSQFLRKKPCELQDDSCQRLAVIPSNTVRYGTVQYRTVLQPDFQPVGCTSTFKMADRQNQCGKILRDRRPK